MNKRDVEVDFLEKIQELTEIQVFCSVDEKYKKPQDIKKERCVSRTLTSTIIEKYTDTREEENNKIYTQINIYRNSISFTFTGDSKHIQKAYEFFSHIQGQGWWIGRKGFKYVIEDMTGIMDISSNLPSGYIEKNVIDITVRIQDISECKIPLVKKANFKLGGIANVRNN